MGCIFVWHKVYVTNLLLNLTLRSGESAQSFIHNEGICIDDKIDSIQT